MHFYRFLLNIQKNIYIFTIFQKNQAKMHENHDFLQKKIDINRKIR